MRFLLIPLIIALLAIVAAIFLAIPTQVGAAADVAASAILLG